MVLFCAVRGPLGAEQECAAVYHRTAGGARSERSACAAWRPAASRSPGRSSAPAGGL